MRLFLILRIMIMKSNSTSIFLLIRTFLNDYHSGFRRSSKHTIRNNRTLLRLYVQFMSEQFNVKVTSLSIEHLNAHNVEEFIKWLVDSKDNSYSSANLRLRLIKGFCSYVITKEPELTDKMLEIKNIKPFREPIEPVGFLSTTHLQQLFGLPDITSKKGLRDRLLLIVMYETGARLSEVNFIKYSDFIKNDAGYVCNLLGKGKKRRVVPISSKVMEHVEFFREKDGADIDSYIFHAPRSTSQPLSQSAIYKIITTYGDRLSKLTDGAVKIVHPHMLRHTMAMHLYQKGVSLEFIAQILGHSSIETTSVYAFADTEMKRQAIEGALNKFIPDNDEDASIWDDEEKLLKLAMLK